MKKRIVCVLLTLIMLVGMLPLSASAAGKSISESAITVLKQMQNYSKTCHQHNAEWRNGYGTICTEKGSDHTAHSITEKDADKALRAKLKELDAAVNASGLTLSQQQHDALVVFTYDCGTAWLNGTGVLKSAVANGLTGNDFLKAIGQTAYDNSDTTWLWKIDYRDRRMIEANMYLNGVYSNVPPSNYKYVYYDAAGGTMPEGAFNDWYQQYYDTKAVTTMPVPTLKGHTFLGWYYENGMTWVSALSKSHAGEILVAKWQKNNAAYTDAAEVYNWLSLNMLASATIYEKPFVKAADAKIIGTQTKKDVILDRDYIASDGTRWSRLQGNKGWVRVKNGVNGVAGVDTPDIDVIVTVTNGSLNSRVNASVSSKINGTYKKGDQLRIITTEMGSGMLWGQVADADGVAIGWVVLKYTNWSDVKDNPSSSNTANNNNTNVVATAIIDCDYWSKYLNVYKEAGTENDIIGSVSDGDHVNIYEIKYVNGHQWGRITEGWILLTYADVTILDKKVDVTTDADALNYAFTGKLKTELTAHVSATENSDTVGSKLKKNSTVTVVMIKVGENGNLWGYNGTGWIDMDNINMNIAKYQVVSDAVTVRDDYNAGANVVDRVIKGVELDINLLAVEGASIWGYTEKYHGWVNLNSKDLQRNNAPVMEKPQEKDEGTNTLAGKIGTVINTDNLKVRSTDAAYGTLKGTLSRGTSVQVWESNEDASWYKVDSNKNGVYDYEDDGWVSGKYLSVYDSDEEEETTTGSGTTTVETGLGIVANTYTGVRIRTGPGTGYGVNGQYLNGTSIEILEVQDAGTAKWGRTNLGWVCMDYVTMVSKYPINNPNSTPATDPNAGQNAGGSTSTTEGNTTFVSTPAVYTGSVILPAPVQKTADVDALEVSWLNIDQSVTIHELVKATTKTTETVGSVVDGNANTTTQTVTTSVTYWARVNGGWVKDPQKHLKLNPLNERTYTVVNYNDVNIRDGAGESCAVVADIEKGVQVSITKLEIVNDKVWGYIEDLDNGTWVKEDDDKATSGWVRLDTLAEGAITVNTAPTTPTPAPTQPTITLGNTSNVGGYVNNNSGYRYTGKVINTNEVNVRATASTAAGITTQLKYGQSLVIYETVIAENMAWGRCDAGWVYLYYVDLTPVVNGAVDARVVYNENAIIYTDVNCSGVAGTYARMSVIDIYEIVGTMARTDKGWVSTNDLL